VETFLAFSLGHVLANLQLTFPASYFQIDSRQFKHFQRGFPHYLHSKKWRVNTDIVNEDTGSIEVIWAPGLVRFASSAVFSNTGND